MIVIGVNELEDMVTAMFCGHGVEEGEAREVAAHLVGSNIEGHDSHGVIRATWYLDKLLKDEIVPGAEPSIVQERPNTAVLDGHWGFGPPVARKAMELAIRKARERSIGCVVVRHSNHIGRVGAYTRLASAAGMIGMGGVNSHGVGLCVAPAGGIDARLSTNPISIAFPGAIEGGFLLDMTTSVVAEGKMKVKLTRGEPLPEGWAIAHDGSPAQRAEQFYHAPKGALLPFGGPVAYKGFGLSMAMDVLTGALSGAGCSSFQARRHGNACFFLAMDIEAFASLEDFKRQVDGLAQHVRSARPAPGSEGVLVAGEPELRHARGAAERGILLERPTWEDLVKRASAVGVAVPRVREADAGVV